MRIPIISSSLEDLAKAKKYYKQGRTVQALHHGTQGLVNITVPAVIGGVAYDIHKENKMVKEELEKLRAAGLGKQAFIQSGFDQELIKIAGIISGIRAGLKAGQKAGKKYILKGKRVSSKWDKKIEKMPLLGRIGARAATLPFRLTRDVSKGLYHAGKGALHGAETVLKYPKITAAATLGAASIPVAAAAQSAYGSKSQVAPRYRYRGEMGG
jgi:hypothetical protein